MLCFLLFSIIIYKKITKIKCKAEVQTKSQLRLPPFSKIIYEPMIAEGALAYQ